MTLSGWSPGRLAGDGQRPDRAPRMRASRPRRRVMRRPARRRWAVDRRAERAQRLADQLEAEGPLLAAPQARVAARVAEAVAAHDAVGAHLERHVGEARDGRGREPRSLQLLGHRSAATSARPSGGHEQHARRRAGARRSAAISRAYCAIWLEDAVVAAGDVVGVEQRAHLAARARAARSGVDGAPAGRDPRRRTPRRSRRGRPRTSSRARSPRPARL